MCKEYDLEERLERVEIFSYLRIWQILVVWTAHDFTISTNSLKRGAKVVVNDVFLVPLQEIIYFSYQLV